MKIDYPSITKFQQLVELKDFKPATKKEYVRYVRRLSDRFQCDPATLTEDQLRSYFLFLRQDKKFSGSAMSIAKAALQLFFREHLGHTEWKVFSELVIRRGLPLPLVLSREEVQRTLGCLREERFRVCLRLIYHCGLRVGEAVKIKVTDIDSTQLRLRIVQGKGGKDRYVPLTQRLVEELRAFWRTHRNPQWLFPAPGRSWKERAEDRNAVLRRATTCRVSVRCRTPSAWRGRRAGFIRKPVFTRCAIVTPHICWRKASACGSSRSTSGTPRWT
jgi:integrase